MHTQQQRTKSVPRPAAPPRLALRLLLLGLLALPAAAAGGAAAADEAPPVAVITALIVNEQLRADVAATEVMITRAGGASTGEPAKTNAPLYKGDKIETFAGASVKLLFIKTPPEKQNELTVAEKSQLVIGSAYCPWVCKWYADLKDRFYGKTKKVRLADQGTKYDVTVKEDGGVLLVVFEGAVLVERLDETPPPPGPPGEERAEVVSAGAGPGSSYSIRRAAFARDPSPQNETGCPEAPAAKPGSICVKSLEALVIPGGEAATPTAPLPTPTPLKEQEVRDALLWSSRVEIAAHPSDRATANGNYARKSEFPDEKDRADKFVEARFQSVWTKQPDSFLTLARVYKDWGEGAKTLANTEEARKGYRRQNPNWQETAGLLYTEAEAHALLGNFEAAERKITQAVQTAPQTATTAQAMRATIKYRQADAAYKRNNIPLAKQFLGEAVVGFKAAANGGADEQTMSVVLANLGQTLKVFGNIAQQEKQYDEALKRYGAARQFFKQSYKFKVTPFSEKAVADIYRDQGRIYFIRGDDERGDQQFALAEMTYLKSAKENEEFGDPYCGLVSILLITDNDFEKAKEYFSKCLAYNPAALSRAVEVPNATGRTKAQAVVMFLDVGLLPQFTGEGDVVVGQAIEPGRQVRRGTTVPVQLGVGARIILPR